MILKLSNKLKTSAGFTLLELMITLLLSIIVIGSIYTAFQSQQHTYIVEDQVAEMQQNIRAALMLMVRDIRMAGYDPTGRADAGVTLAQKAQFGFTYDLDEDRDVTTTPDETVTFKMNNDADGDGMVDGGGVSTIGRKTGDGVIFQPVAENIQALEFNYLDYAGNVATRLTDIRSVQISVLARAGNPDRDFTDTKSYTTASGASWGPFNDNYHRRFLIMTVRCRNLGL